MNLSYDIRIQGILPYKGKRGTTYAVRWTIAGRPFRQTFATKALAESHRSKLLIAQREGTAFDRESGLPEPLARKANSVSWLRLAMDFADVKWPHASPKHRVNIAESLAVVTPALLASHRGAPSDSDLRSALYGWAFNRHRRGALDTAPENITAALRWLDANTVPVAELSEPAIVRKALDLVALRLDGKAAAPNTVARRRAVFYGALRYAVERRLLDSHPFAYVGWTAPKSDTAIDRRTVVNHGQARALLAAVAEVRPDLEAFYACIYYAALRPEEVLGLTRESFTPPAAGEQWGILQLTGSTVTLGKEWGDDGTTMHHHQALKHRADNATRIVPVVPPLVQLLTGHLARYAVQPGGGLFVTRRGASPGAPIGSSTYTRIWRAARTRALTPEQAASPLARVPYDLRHAAVSTWLNAGVPAPQVAEWAGHSLHVLLRVYAKCIDGEQDTARDRIGKALGLDAAQTSTRIRHDESDPAGSGETQRDSTGS